MVGVMFAGILAFVSAAECPAPQSIDAERSHASAIVMQLREGAFRTRFDSPYESTERIVAGSRTVFIGYSNGAMGSWAEDLRYVCKARIDGYEAELFTWKVGDERRIGAAFLHNPMHGSGFSVDLPHDPDDIGSEMSELQSIRFVNDPYRLKLVKITRVDGVPSAVFRNEIGEEFSAGFGRPVTRGAGMGRGYVKAIKANTVDVEEYAGTYYITYVYSTRHPVRRFVQ